ncbi:PEP/pyruvate-binding domain-containing protein [Nesterenkonia sp. DZ6]|uniref:PEP/pyruvate-binding domain-containing protein n=1 Tax=Nesterenkonia sp. DZ6 TaxID=2901229 RepID=UPI001F4CB547|nr:PEP/pyruvate-binding domain-containing protein [Nesterenkonia sp. DZ6]MCH8560334.1 hypothetical protein [Nesterenkonia sp. DZ6]
MGKYTKRFEELSSTDRETVGGKCASLGEMVQAQLPVPAGFAVTVDAYEDFRDTQGRRQKLRDIVTGVDPENSASLQLAHDQAVALILEAELPATIQDEITEAYLQLTNEVAARRGEDKSDRIAVAVRSSSVDEDGDAASFAGQQETYLWVTGVDDVIAKVRECWASLYTPQAVAYRSRMPETEGMEASKISVAVQLMADADVAGVTFTVSPRTGDRSVVAINASWGLGQAVVSGEVTPDEFWLSKVGPKITERRIARKDHEYVPNPEGTGIVFQEVDEARREEPCLSDEELFQLCEIGVRVEKHYGFPQDIEWAMERHADGTSHVMLLQARPETHWKKRRADKDKKTPATTTGLLNLVSQAAKGAQG